MERQELIDMIETIEEEENAKLKAMKDQFESTREETKNRNVEELESMKHELIKKIEELDKEFEINFNKYVQETETKADNYKELLAKNEDDSKKIGEKQKSIFRIKEQIAMWTIKLQQNKKECEDRDSNLRKEKDMIVRHYHDLKRKMF